jgi:hypothetical protein
MIPENQIKRFVIVQYAKRNLNASITVNGNKNGKNSIIGDQINQEI